MIGQELLLEQLDTMIEHHQLPRFSIILGERGAEHEDVAHYVANQIKADYILLPDVKVDTIRNMIKQAYTLHHFTVFCIPNADDMSINAKNALLKVVEDTPNRAYFFMCLEDLNNTLQTLISRSQILYMRRASSEDIKTYCRSMFKDSVNEEVIKIASEICTTPGEVCLLIKMGAVNFYRYVEWVADNIFTVPSAEIFNLSGKLSVKEDDEKYDCLLFLRAFQTVLMKKVCQFKLETNAEEKYKLTEVIRATGQYMQDLRVKGINRTMLIDAWALEVRKIWKSQT